MTENVEVPEIEVDNEKASKKHIRGSSLLFAGRIISIGLKTVLQLLIINYLAKAEYGAFTYALNFVEIAAILCLISLDHAASRFISLYQEADDYDSIFGFMVISVITVFGIGIAITIMLLSAHSLIFGTLIQNELSLSMLSLMIILAPLQAMDSWFQSVFAAFSSVKAIFFRRYLLGPGLQIAAVVIVMLLQQGVYLLALGYLIAGVLGTILYIRLLFSLLRSKNIIGRFRWETIKIKPAEVLGFSLPLFTSGLVFIFRSQLAIVFLEFFKGLDAVADFRGVQPIANLNSLVYGSFVFLYLPLASRLFARNDGAGINDLYWRTAAWISIATFPIFIVTFAFAPEYIPLIFPAEYASAAPVMSIMALAYYLNAVLGFNVQTIRAYGNVRYLMGVDFTVMLVAVASYAIFIPLYGAIGGAIAFTIAIVLANILYHIGLVRFTAVNLFNPTYLQVYLSIIVATILVSLLQFLVAPPLYISLPIAVLVSLVLLRLNADKLKVGEIFPELLKVPFAKYLLKS
jgi:O-antigen/teichoic acid export membrane protein